MTKRSIVATAYFCTSCPCDDRTSRQYRGTTRKLLDDGMDV